MFQPESDHTPARLTNQEWWSGVLRPTLFLGLVIGALACYAYSATQELVRDNVASELRAIARLKVGQIERWLAQRHDDAEMVATPQFRLDLKRWLDSGQNNETLRQQLLKQLTVSADVLEPRAFDLHALDGRPLLSAALTPDPEAALQKAREAAHSGHEVFEPLHFALAPRRPGHPRPPLQMGYLSPLRLNKNGEVLAVLHARIDPENVLFPMLQTWPGNSPSAETMILRLEGEQILYLNDLRHLPDSALKTSRPLENPPLIGSQVIAKGEGFYEAPDYRGIRSLGYALPIPGSTLYLVAKIDHDEVFHDLNTLTALMSALCALVLAAFATWLQHRKRHEKRLTLLLDERQQMQDEITASRDRLRQLAIHDNAIREAERKHVARELHDELGQLLTALKMHLSLLQMQFDRIPGLMEKTEDMRLIVEKTIATVRHTVSRLRPPALDLGLVGALEWQVEEFTRHTGIACRYEGPDGEPTIDAETAAVIFRLVQESLTNVARHAQARQVVIRLSNETGILRLSISDDGIGFDIDETTHNRKNFGLIGMQERVHLLQGHLKITSAPRQGTRIDIELPTLSLRPHDTPTPDRR